MNKSLLFWMKNEIESVQYVRKSLLVWSEHENPKNEAMQYLVTRSDYYKLNPSNRIRKDCKHIHKLLVKEEESETAFEFLFSFRVCPST